MGSPNQFWPLVLETDAPDKLLNGYTWDWSSRLTQILGFFFFLYLYAKFQF